MTINPIGGIPNTSLAIIPKNRGAIATITENKTVGEATKEVVKSNKKLAAIIVGIAAGITAIGVAVKKYIDNKKANQEQKPTEQTVKA